MWTLHLLKICHRLIPLWRNMILRYSYLLMWEFNGPVKCLKFEVIGPAFGAEVKRSTSNQRIRLLDFHLSKFGLPSKQEWIKTGVSLVKNAEKCHTLLYNRETNRTCWISYLRASARHFYISKTCDGWCYAWNVSAFSVFHIWGSFQKLWFQ